MPRKAANIWTEDQRTVLLLLHQEFTFDEASRTSIFNLVFDDELRNHGFVRGLTSSVLSSQYSERKRPNRAPQWRLVMRTASSSNERASRDALRQRVRDAVVALGFGGAANDLVNRPVTPSLHREKEEQSGNDKPQGLTGGLESSVTARNLDGAGEISLAPQDGKSMSRSKSLECSFDDKAGLQQSSKTGTTAQQRSHGNSEDFMDENNQTEEVQNTAPLASTAVLPPSRLDMLHRDRLTWKGIPPSLDLQDQAIVNHLSAVYQHGGEVHRFYLAESQHVDYMLCDASCEDCNGSSKSSTSGQVDGLPFVHASDTIRKNGMTIFEPSQKDNRETVPICYPRKVRFHSTRGEVSVIARVCDYVQCRFCSGSEHIRVQENAKMDKQGKAE